jgi:hypothetical protein
MPEDLAFWLLLAVLTLDLSSSCGLFGCFLNIYFSLFMILLRSSLDMLSKSLLLASEFVSLSFLFPADFWLLFCMMRGENLLEGARIGLSLRRGAPLCLAWIYCFIISIYAYFLLSASFDDLITNCERRISCGIGASFAPEALGLIIPI